MAFRTARQRSGAGRATAARTRWPPREEREEADHLLEMSPGVLADPREQTTAGHPPAALPAGGEAPRARVEEGPRPPAPGPAVGATRAAIAAICKQQHRAGRVQARDARTVQHRAVTRGGRRTHRRRQPVGAVDVQAPAQRRSGPQSPGSAARRKRRLRGRRSLGRLSQTPGLQPGSQRVLGSTSTDQPPARLGQRRGTLNQSSRRLCSAALVRLEQQMGAVAPARRSIGAGTGPRPRRRPPPRREPVVPRTPRKALGARAGPPPPGTAPGGRRGRPAAARSASAAAANRRSPGGRAAAARVLRVMGLDEDAARLVARPARPRPARSAAPALRAQRKSTPYSPWSASSTTTG